jgi:hypothetical protein
VAAVARFAHQVQRTRGDHNGRVLSLRASDMDTLALTTGRSADLLIEALRERGAIHEEDAPSAV